MHLAGTINVERNYCQALFAGLTYGDFSGRILLPFRQFSLCDFHCGSAVKKLSYMLTLQSSRSICSPRLILGHQPLENSNEEER